MRGSSRKTVYGRSIPVLLLLFPLLIAGCGGAKIRPIASGSVVLAFGDSLTYGTGANRDQSYPVLLQKALGCKVINSGVPGETSKKGLRRLPKELAEYNPSLVILCHGGNDVLRRYSKEETVSNITSMIEMAKNRGADVILIGVPKPGLLLSAAKFYEEIAEAHKLPYEGKVLGEILSHRSLKSDRVHPNAKGYEKLAKAIANLIRKYEE